MKLYITGGNSFLGKTLLPLLKESNIDYYSPSSKEVNILNYFALDAAIKEYKPDAILNMAALCGGILRNKNHPADFLRDNTQMGLNIYEAARINEIKYVYSLGSVCMYPVNCPTPFKEDDIFNGFPELTNSPYGQSKRTLLMLSQTYRQQYDIKGAFLVPVNMFGINDHFDLVNGHVIPALINKFVSAVEENKSTVYCWGSGTATREFLYSTDCAEAIIKSINIKLNTDLPINLGTGIEISIKNLAELIAELTEFTGEIIFDGSVSDGQPRRMLDVSRAKNILEWEAKTSLKDGLIKTIEWFKSNRST